MRRIFKLPIDWYQAEEEEDEEPLQDFRSLFHSRKRQSDSRRRAYRDIRDFKTGFVGEEVPPSALVAPPRETEELPQVPVICHKLREATAEDIAAFEAQSQPTRQRKRGRRAINTPEDRKALVKMFSQANCQA